jgi:hypothetical protein
LVDEEYVAVAAAIGVEHELKRVFTVINASSFVIAAQILDQRKDLLQ